jgi:hypothetical protein
MVIKIAGSPIEASHTAKFKLCELITYLAFKDRTKALSFKKYLKSHAGITFTNKGLW